MADDDSGRGLLTCPDVRRLIHGILDNMDMGILTRTSLLQKAQELLLANSEYWLSYAGAALIYWLLDERAAAERSLQRALNLDDERTSLFFLLVMVREKRGNGIEKWLERYLGELDPFALSMDVAALLNVYTAGLLPAPLERRVTQTLSSWLQEQEEDPEVSGRVLAQWRQWLQQQHQGISLSKEEQFERLKNTAHASAAELLQRSHLPGAVLKALRQIVQTRPQQEEDRKEAGQYLYAFIDSDQDWEEGEETEPLSYAGLLTGCILEPETYGASPALRQYALAAAKSWIRSAFDDVQAETVQKFPDHVDFYTELPGLPVAAGQQNQLNFSSRDGSNEREILQELQRRIAPWKQSELDKNRPGWKVFAQLFCILGGGALLIFGGGWVLTNYPYAILALAAVVLVCAAGLAGGLILTAILAAITRFIMESLTALYASHSSLCVAAVIIVLTLLSVRLFRQTLGKRRGTEHWFRQYTADKETQICSCLAETADFYDFYMRNMSRQKDLKKFLNGLNTADFVRRRSGTGRHIRMQEDKS